MRFVAATELVAPLVDRGGRRQAVPRHRPAARSAGVLAVTTDGRLHAAPGCWPIRLPPTAVMDRIVRHATVLQTTRASYRFVVCGGRSPRGPAGPSRSPRHWSAPMGSGLACLARKPKAADSCGSLRDERIPTWMMRLGRALHHAPGPLYFESLDRPSRGRLDRAGCAACTDSGPSRAAAARELGDRLREEAPRAQSNEDLVRRFVEDLRRRAGRRGTPGRRPASPSGSRPGLRRGPRASARRDGRRPA